jgi:hypothetical protein
MTAHRILTTKMKDIVPRSSGERTTLPVREHPPKNTISNEAIARLIGVPNISSDLVGSGLLPDIAIRISETK